MSPLVRSWFRLGAWWPCLMMACTTPEPFDTGQPDPPDTTILPMFNELSTEPLGFGATWCGLSYDGTNLLITSETGGDIWAVPHDLDGFPLAEEIQIATREDAGEQQIADHVQLFENGRHLIAFSISGEGQGGDLFLLQLNTDLERIALDQLLNDDPPTNDMFMVSNDNGIGIGTFEPGVGHQILALDSDYELKDTVTIGGGEAVHANGASGVYVDDRIHLLAPITLAPATNDRFIHLEIGGDWELLDSEVVMRGNGELGMVSALTFLPEYRLFVAHYTDGMEDTGGDITRLIFDEDWNLLDQRVVLEGVWSRPKSLLVNDRFYLCADGGEAVRLHVYELTDPL